ncbi:unnamed protein product [Sympodiomycopsis kandeliae]
MLSKSRDINPAAAVLQVSAALPPTSVPGRLGNRWVGPTKFEVIAESIQIVTSPHRYHNLIVTFRQDGQRSKDSKDLLQGQDLQEAHPTQGHPIQDR